MDIRKSLDEVAHRLPHKTALIYRHHKISFEQLRAQACSLSRALKEHGVDQGDKIGILLPNCPEFAICYLAAVQMGVVAIPMDMRLSREEIGSMLKNWSISTFIAHHSHTQLARELQDELRGLLRVIIVGGTSDQPQKDNILPYETLFQYPGEINWEINIQGAYDALILYTSGTTGQPKGVVLTYDHLDCFPATIKLLGVGESDINAILLPMSHISGPILINHLIVVGSTLVILDTIRPETILEAIATHRINWFHGVPPIFQALLKGAREKKYDTSSLRFVAMMGAPVPLTLMQDFQARFPQVKVIQGYGLTETSPLVTLVALEDWERKLGSAGKPVPGAEIRIVDDEGRSLPPGSVGEVIIKGPQVMKGYYNNPEATAQVIKDGWFHSGDLGRFDSDNYLYIVGRKKDMIITGGLNVYPIEIEECLLQHPAIAEAAVIGIPDFMRGERIKAVIVPKPGEQLAKKDIQSYCREYLADFKVPDLIEFRDSLPKTTTGKIARTALY
jgi:long-chain acyl-CoA synthetase